MIMGSVLGSGLIILPGLAYQHVGVYSFFSWLGMSFFIIPFIYVFTKIGRDHPSAGGVVHFIQTRLNTDVGVSITYMMIASVSLLVPVVGVIAANYFGYIASLTNREVVAVAWLLLVLSTLVNTIKPEIALHVQSISSTFLLLFLIAVVSIGFSESFPKFYLKIQNVPLVSQDTIPSVWKGMTLVFWAFLGWENLSFMTEEFTDVKRHLVISSIMSYFIMVALYLGLSASVIGLLAPDAPMTAQAPMAQMLHVVFGYWGGIGAATIACLIMVLNINAWVWGASRLLFSTARDGLCPTSLGTVGSAGTPGAALCFLLIPYSIVFCGMAAFGKSQLGVLIKLINANFILLYLITLWAFQKKNRGKTDTTMAYIAIGTTIYFFSQFRVYALMSILLFTVIFFVSRSYLPRKKMPSSFVS